LSSVLALEYEKKSASTGQRFQQAPWRRLYSPRRGRCNSSSLLELFRVSTKRTPA